MKYVLYVLILTSALAAGETSALACSCAPPKSPSIERERAAAVFYGRVVAVKEHKSSSNSSGMVEAVFEVSRAWKGVVGRTISVFTHSSSAACGYGFTVGVDYLVYAYGGDGQLRTGLCSRTKRLDQAQTDLDELGSGEEVSMEAPGGPQTGGEIKVKVGRKVVLKDEGLRVRFDSVASDSRCPEGALCIWEGDAEVKVTVKAGRKTRIFHLHTSQRYAQEGAFGGYIVRLISLSPHPKAGERLKAKNYVAILRVTKKSSLTRSVSLMDSVAKF